MKVGDLVRSYLTDQIGIVIATSSKVQTSQGHVLFESVTHSFQVSWCTSYPGEPVGATEWTGLAFVEVISEGG